MRGENMNICVVPLYAVEEVWVDLQDFDFEPIRGVHPHTLKEVVENAKDHYGYPMTTTKIVSYIICYSKSFAKSPKVGVANFKIYKQQSDDSYLVGRLVDHSRDLSPHDVLDAYVDRIERFVKSHLKIVTT